MFIRVASEALAEEDAWPGAHIRLWFTSNGRSGILSRLAVGVSSVIIFRRAGESSGRWLIALQCNKHEAMPRRGLRPWVQIPWPR